jgi:cytochrome c oxidase assembly protein subunit 15
VHRNFAFIVLVASAMRCGARGLTPCAKPRATSPTLARRSATGLATIYLSWPLTIAVLHNAGALLVFC